MATLCSEVPKLLPNPPGTPLPLWLKQVGQQPRARYVKHSETSRAVRNQIQLVLFSMRWRALNRQLAISSADLIAPLASWFQNLTCHSLLIRLSKNYGDMLPIALGIFGKVTR